MALIVGARRPFYADLAGKRPAFRILAEGQKSGRDEVLPMTPDFAQCLLQTPEDERHGRVFKLVRERGRQLDRPRKGWGDDLPRSARRPAW